MFLSIKLKIKLDSFDEGALRITYNHRKTTFGELLNKDNSVSIHRRDL